MIDNTKLKEEIYDMMKENDAFRDKYKKDLHASSATAIRLAEVGEIYGRAIDRKLKLLELCILERTIG